MGQPKQSYIIWNQSIQQTLHEIFVRCRPLKDESQVSFHSCNYKFVSKYFQRNSYLTTEEIRLDIRDITWMKLNIYPKEQMFKIKFKITVHI